MNNKVDVTQIFHRNQGSAALIIVVILVMVCLAAVLCGGCMALIIFSTAIEPGQNWGMLPLDEAWVWIMTCVNSV